MNESNSFATNSCTQTTVKASALYSYVDYIPAANGCLPLWHIHTERMTARDRRQQLAWIGWRMSLQARPGRYWCSGGGGGGGCAASSYSTLAAASSSGG